jgi:hypothetical protein
VTVGLAGGAASAVPPGRNPASLVPRSAARPSHRPGHTAGSVPRSPAAAPLVARGRGGRAAAAAMAMIVRGFVEPIAKELRL